MRRTCITGVSGFIGRELAAHLVDHGHSVSGTVRSMPAGGAAAIRPEVEIVTGAVLTREFDWRGALAGCDTVVHAANIPHGDATPEMYHRINVLGTLHVAEAAAEAGVRRFVYLSSINVNGNSNTRPYTEEDEPRPADEYGASKRDAEIGLKELLAGSAMEFVILRPTTVYGPGALGNLALIERLMRRGVPLPFGAIDNRRGRVAIGNLVDLARRAIEDPRAANQTFLSSDGEDVSTGELVRRMGDALGMKPRLVPMPPGLLIAAASLLGRGEDARRLCQSMMIDISKARTFLDWSPKLSLAEGLRIAFGRDRAGG